jgi:hypothetical protein
VSCFVDLWSLVLFFSLFCVGLDRAWLARDAILTERLVSVRKKAEVKISNFCTTTLISQTCLFNSNRKFCGGHD